MKLILIVFMFIAGFGICALGSSQWQNGFITESKNITGFNAGKIGGNSGTYTNFQPQIFQLNKKSSDEQNPAPYGIFVWAVARQRGGKLSTNSGPCVIIQWEDKNGKTVKKSINGADAYNAVVVPPGISKFTITPYSSGTPQYGGSVIVWAPGANGFLKKPDPNLILDNATLQYYYDFKIIYNPKNSYSRIMSFSSPNGEMPISNYGNNSGVELFPDFFGDFDSQLMYNQKNWDDNLPVFSGYMNSTTDNANLITIGANVRSDILSSGSILSYNFYFQGVMNQYYFRFYEAPVNQKLSFLAVLINRSAANTLKAVDSIDPNSQFYYRFDSSNNMCISDFGRTSSTVCKDWLQPPPPNKPNPKITKDDKLIIDSYENTILCALPIGYMLTQCQQYGTAPPNKIGRVKKYYYANINDMYKPDRAENTTQQVDI